VIRLDATMVYVARKKIEPGVEPETIAAKCGPAFKKHIQAIVDGMSDAQLRVRITDVIMASVQEWAESNDERRWEILRRVFGTEARLAAERLAARQKSAAALRKDEGRKFVEEDLPASPQQTARRDRSAKK
jgi:hypothetical protein